MLDEFESDLSDGSDMECQTEHRAMFLAVGERVGPSTDIKYLAKQDQATRMESQEIGDEVSRVVRSHGDKLGSTIDERENQKLVALKSLGC